MMTRALCWLGELVCEYWLLIIAAMFMVTLCVMMVSPSKYVRAPAESCAASYTGNTQEGSYTTCAAYNAQGACTAPMEMPYTMNEVRIQCDFKEWR